MLMAPYAECRTSRDGCGNSFYGVEWLIAANVLSFAVCIAFTLLRPQVKAWPYATLFSSWIFVFSLVATILRLGS